MTPRQAPRPERSTPAPDAPDSPATPSAGSATGAAAAPPRRRGLGKGLAGAAVLIAGLTVLARVAGFGRQVVFNAAVGQNNLGDAYTTANYVPNIVFDIVAGGALAGLVVPLLAGPLARGRADESRRTASALLTWTVLVLVPVTVAGLALARPLMELLLRDKADTPGMLDLATRFLVMFLPQILLYGLAVVSAGILQAHHRFTAAAVAPLLSSLVVAGAYLAFAAGYDGTGQDVTAVPRGSELALGVGTTAGVLALALCTLVPLRGIGLGLRPTLRFPPGIAARARALALAGVATLVAQQLATVAVLMLVNAYGPDGGAVTYQNAWMVYVLPYAVLAVPIATSAFPRLSAAAHDGDHPAFAATAAATTRAVLLVCGAGAAVLAAAAYPVGAFFAHLGGGPHTADPAVLARALVAFAPGLAGYGLVAHLGRTLYARGHGRASAGAVVVGWTAVILTDVLLVPNVDEGWTVAALGLGNTVGMTAAGLLLAAATARTAGTAALSGAGRAALGALVAGTAGGAAGAAVAAAAGTGGTAYTLIIGAAAAIVGAVVFAAAAYPFAGADLRAIRRGRPAPHGPTEDGTDEDPSEGDTGEPTRRPPPDPEAP
ncbi:murein biosynthesis integral membrane protein MurJ [Yinghuangia seranimata]|uniref:murein biosynthesis integral membrane protein MurJ n=1 Tax=Yinghuangia seranimata TaxID=408067 RepID=UPI00248BAA2D|nr:lipid II flippase MurJ [Yinghuangia seranimata]MDI2131836.1 lipid II flippase MurJ [Yinghuangia seranimata]